MPSRRVTRQTKAVAEDSIPSPEPSTTPPPPSFKGQLSRFQYTPTPPTSDTASLIPGTAIRASKRQRASSPPTTGSNVLTTESLTSVSISQPIKKQKRKPSSYAPPSKYAHLSPLTDILTPNLICVFVGTNPGVQTATLGHAYAHPSNNFWKLLHLSGLTERRLSPSEDRSLPARYCMGNTNIVSRPSKDAAELSREEMLEGAAELERKFAEFRPEAVCIVGKGIWEAIWRFRVGRAIKKQEFRYGWQEEGMNMGKVEGEVGWKGSRVFVATSTSGLAAGLSMKEKEAIWRPFGEWVRKRREERGFVAEEGKGNGDVGVEEGGNA